jgi:hypothetical protein
MSFIPHTPYSPDLALCNFFLFPKMKLKLKGRRFGTIDEIQAESQTVFDILIEMDFQESFQTCRRRWTGVYMREETTSRVMAADRPYGEFYKFYSFSPEYSGYILLS